MFPQAPSSIYQSSKCFITYGSMGHVDPTQKPAKGKPWNAIMDQDFVHRVDLIFPQEDYEAFNQAMVKDQEVPCFYRVIMPLGQILHGDFFTQYVKRGNILMFSEGKIPSNNVFSLREGVLTMYLDRETYERAGLTGKPFGARGNRGSRPRWVVSYNLRSPSMLHGKRGFNRLVYACKETLNWNITWLFCNVCRSVPTPDPLEIHAPIKFCVSPHLSRNIRALKLPMTTLESLLANGDRQALEELAVDLYEWLSMVRLDSPRISVNDNIDPFLSRYRVPGGAQSSGQICKLSWRGFMSAEWLRDVVIDVLHLSSPHSWFSISSTTFAKSLQGGSEELSLLKPPNTSGEYLMWQVKGV